MCQKGYVRLDDISDSEGNGFSKKNWNGFFESESYLLYGKFILVKKWLLEENLTLLDLNL